MIHHPHPAHSLLEHAHRHSFDLIVCGQHHSRRAGRPLLHGVAEDLIHAGSIPVLVVGEEPE